MKGLLNFKPILKDIVVHATLDEFGQIMLTSRSIHEWFLKNEDNVLMHLKKAIGEEFMYIKYETYSICYWAMCNSPTDLKYVDNQTEDICLDAVTRDGMALEFVERKTRLVCFMAVSRDGKALQFVDEQDEEMCLEAIRNNIEAIHYVKDKTDKIRRYVLRTIETLKFSNEGSLKF